MLCHQVVEYSIAHTVSQVSTIIKRFKSQFTQVARTVLQATVPMDTFGCFYSNSFDPSNPSQNLIEHDDDSGGQGQFRITVTLIYGYTYVLVVTTHLSSNTGTFSITALGPASVIFTSTIPPRE